MYIELSHRRATAEQKAAAVGVSMIVMALKGPTLFFNQESITKAIVDMILDQNMPLKIVEKPSVGHVLAVASSNRYKTTSERSTRARDKIIAR